MNLNTRKMWWEEIRQLNMVAFEGWKISAIPAPSEKVQLAAVRNMGWAIQYIENPSEAVQLAAVENDCYSVRFIKNPSNEIIKIALTNPECPMVQESYELTVREVFKGKGMLMKKWLRYGDVMRGGV